MTDREDRTIARLALAATDSLLSMIKQVTYDAKTINNHHLKEPFIIDSKNGD